MRNVVKGLLALALFAASAWIGIEVIAPALRMGKQAPPPTTAAEGLPRALRQRIAEASDDEIGTVLREALARHKDHILEDELRGIALRRAVEATPKLWKSLDHHVSEFRYRSAIELLERFRKRWRGITSAATAARDKIKELREEQQAQVDGRFRESDEARDAGRWEAARETLKTNWEFEAVYRKLLDDRLVVVERRIRALLLQGPGSRPPGPLPTTHTPAPAATVILSRPPPLPGYPHPDVKRLAEARVLVRKAKSLFGSGRHVAATKALDDLLGYYGDLAYVKRNREAASAMAVLSRFKATRSLAAFFHAAKATVKGRRVTLRYNFTTSDEHLDWIAERTLPYQSTGEFEPARKGVRGTGGMSFLLRAFFENNVSMKCLAKIQKPRSHGLLFCQDGNETRQLMRLVTNHKIVEGENYVKPRPGHSVLMFGKGTNNDVPIDSPDTGFIFKGASKTSPAPSPGATLSLSFAVRGDNMVGTVSYRGASATLTYHTKGDDGRSIKRLRPALFVIENGVVFREIVIKGTLHPRFERERVEELLDLIGTMD